MTLDTLWKTALLSLRQPRAGMRVVLGWDLSLRDSALALALMAIVSAGLGGLVIQVPPEADPLSATILSNPIYLAMVQCVGLGLISVFIHLLGRASRSQATLPQAVAVMAWVEALWISISAAEIIAVILVPPLGPFVVMAGTAFSLWLMVSFVAELHGFLSLFLTLLGVILAFIGAMIAAVFVLMLLLVLGVLHV